MAGFEEKSVRNRIHEKKNLNDFYLKSDEETVSY